MMGRDAGVDLVFNPPPEEMYQPGAPDIVVDVPTLSTVLEGRHRPGHFKGVCQVVAKLLNIIAPQFACFGQKDYQQLRIITAMVQGLDLPVTVVPCPALRDPDGLAMSSRNVYLNPKEREAALILAKSLSLARKLWGKGERNADTIRKEMTSLIKTEPLGNIEYVSVADAETLEELAKIDRNNGAGKKEEESNIALTSQYMIGNHYAKSDTQ